MSWIVDASLSVKSCHWCQSVELVLFNTSIVSSEQQILILIMNSLNSLAHKYFDSLHHSDQHDHNTAVAVLMKWPQQTTAARVYKSVCETHLILTDNYTVLTLQDNISWRLSPLLTVADRLKTHEYITLNSVSNIALQALPLKKQNINLLLPSKLKQFFNSFTAKKNQMLLHSVVCPCGPNTVREGVSCCWI